MPKSSRLRSRTIHYVLSNASKLNFVEAVPAYFVQTQTHCKNTTAFSLMVPLSGNRSRPFLVSLDTWTVFRRSLDLSGPQFSTLNPCFRILYPRIRRVKTGI